MLRKNDIVDLEITGMTNEGNGVGRADGVAVFVPMSTVGDVIRCRIVKVMKSYCYGIVESIITSSELRCEPDCSVYSKCGGCAFRHFSYEEEMRVKQEFVKASLERIGKLCVDLDPMIGADKIDRYRNKAQYPLAEQDGKVVCGFYSARSHRVVPHLDCLLQPKIFSCIIADCLDFINSEGLTVYDELSCKGLLRHIYLRRGEYTHETMLCFVVTSFEKAKKLEILAERLAEKYKDIKSIVLNENPGRTNVILGKKLKILAGSDTITDCMCGKTIEISPLSFYQVNTVQAEKLYAAAAEYAQLSGSELLLDLYCGAGTIGLSMSEKAGKLIGVEVIPEAIDNAKRNAAANGVDNAEFICGDAGKIAALLYERGERPNVIIADPARKGCTRDTLEFMAKMSPDRIVMVSCDHTTAARDCAVLEGLGYKAVRARAVDLFPRSRHVETVVKLIRAGL